MFPLLAKDLTERAARGRTYVLRAVFGVVLVGWFAWAMARTGAAGAGARGAGQALLGAGRTAFASIAVALCWALLLIQPALMADALTHEKERGTLSLLLLTPQRPFKLLVEKFAAGLLPMATLLLFGLPLGAVAYAYGGVTPGMLVTTGLILLGTWMEVGAVALLASSWCRTTTGAIVCSYLLLAGFYVGTSPEVRDMASDDSPSRSEMGTRRWSFTAYSSRLGDPDRSFFPLTMVNATVGLPAHYDDLVVDSPEWRVYRDRAGFQSSSTTSLINAEWDANERIAYAAHLFLPALIFLLLSRLFLIRRADPPASLFWTRLFRRLDAFFHRLNRRFGNVTFTAGSRDWEQEPIVFRDATAGILSRPQHVVRLGAWTFILLFFLMIAFGIIGMAGRGGLANQTGSVLGAGTLLCALIVLLRGVNAFGAERSQQTLEILLSTPLPRTQIVREKASLVVRLALALGAAMSVAAVLRWFTLDWYFASFTTSNSTLPGWNLDSATPGGKAAWVDGAIGIAALLVALWEMLWLGLWLGLRIRSRMRATAVALAVAAAWMYVPRLVGDIIATTGPTGAADWAAWLDAVPPDGLAVLANRGALSILPISAGVPNPSTVQVVGASVFLLLLHCTVALMLRMRCLRGANDYLMIG